MYIIISSRKDPTIATIQSLRDRVVTGCRSYTIGLRKDHSMYVQVSTIFSRVVARSE